MESTLVTRVRYNLDGDIEQCDEGKAYDKVVSDRAEENGKLVADGKEPKPAPQLVGKQTFKYYTVQTDADFAQLVPTEAERVTLANRALGLKQANYVRTFMLQDDEDYAKAATEQVIDLATVCAQPAERRVMTKEQKKERALKDLAGMTPDELKALFEQLVAAQTTAAAV